MGDKIFRFIDGALVGVPLGLALQLTGMESGPSILFGIAAAFAVVAILRAIQGEDE